VLRASLHAQGRWRPVLLEGSGGALRAFPLAPLRECAPEDVVRFSRTGEGGVVLGVEDLLDRLRTVRHEINNPLAAALAEVQLQLMDAPDDETRRAFGVVQDQLRRIKALVAALALPAGRTRPGSAA
jgi:signal transduction histidine kinase